MTEKLRFKSEFAVQVLDGEAVFLLSERRNFLLRGTLYARLALLLDGRHSAEDIVQQLRDQEPGPNVYFALAGLRKKGYVVEFDHRVPPTRTAFWQGIGLDATATERRLRDCTVEVTRLGGLSSEPLEEALESLNIRVGPGGDIAIVVTDDYLNPDLADFNIASLASGRSWLLAKPAGTILWIGPVFRPHRSACWECLAARLTVNRRIEAYLDENPRVDAPFPAPIPTLTIDSQIGSQLASIEAVKALVQPGTDTHIPLVTFDLRTLAVQSHAVVRRPQCSRCGEPKHRSARAAKPIELQSHVKLFTADGGHRTVAPEQTVATYEHHVSPITGAVMSLDRISLGEASPVRFYIAAHTSPRKADNLHTLRDILNEVSGGKGMTDAQARASGLCEALERYTGYFWGDEATFFDNYEALGSSAVHPNACMLFSESQYHNRHELTGSGTVHEPVPEPFDEQAIIPWTSVWSLTTNEVKYLPTEYCYAHVPRSRRSGTFYCLADSNGNAAGNTLEEAILQGFLELVERDSVALWWYSRARRPEVDLSSFHDDYIRQLRKWYSTQERDTWVLDITSDLGVHVFVAVSRRKSVEEEIIWGFGSHFDARLAVTRALTELNQKLPRVAIGDIPSELAVDRYVRDWYRNATLDDHPYLAPAENGRRVAADYDVRHTDELSQDVLRCQEIVSQQGMELLILDQTRPEIGLPVVKVIVPGLRHFRARFAQGRLYDVPPQLGWVNEPFTESGLNPTHYSFP